MKFPNICSCFEQAGQELVVVERHGCMALSPAGARIVALAFSEDEDNLFFTHPDLADMAASGIGPAELVGGPGGDRLRFAPEYAYAWDGPDYDLVDFSNYHVQHNEDPGEYTITLDGHDAIFHADTSLIDKRTGDAVRFTVERRVSFIGQAPVALSGDIRFIGYQLRHGLTTFDFKEGQAIDLWGLLQMPTGSTLLVPIHGDGTPVRYFNDGAWTVYGDHLRWPYNGSSNAKIGLSTAQVTGRTGVLREMTNGQSVLIVREFPVRADMSYCDGPSQAHTGDQIFQAWDGFGFGEMEYHSPAIGADPLPEQYQDESSLWAFEGPQTQIHELVRQLLGIAMI